MEKFKDKAVLVTGAGIGIGYEICRQFAAEGALVALNDIDADLAAASAAAINRAAGREAVHAYGCDVANVEAVRAMIVHFAELAGRLDVAVANAGLTGFGDFLSFTPETFDRLTAVNLRGSYFTAQAAVRIMIERELPGRIILMSSVTGGQAYHNLGAYGITKAGIRHMAKALGAEVGKYGVTVNAISPGAIVTERNLQIDPDTESKWSAITPNGRVGHVEDIAAAALFLASPEARHINGQTLEVDGGWTTISPLPAESSETPE